MQGNCSEALRIVQNTSRSLATAFLEPHLHNQSAFSFVPFCAYKSELSPNSGKEHAEMQLPVCSNITTLLINGKLCHTVRMNVSELEPGAKNGFLLLLDPKESRNTVVSKDSLYDKKFAEIHLATLSPHTSSKNGTHILSSLKRVTGSKSFLAQNEEIKGCGNKEFEVCQSQRYFVAVEQQCGCLPWLATFLLEHKVQFSNSS